MDNTCLYHIDLVSRSKFQKESLNLVRSSIKNLISDNQIRSLFLDCLDLNENNQIEIYCESEYSKKISDEELVEILESIENIIGGITDQSRVELKIEIPLSEKVWIKNGFSWELIYEETDSYFKESYDDWGDPDWED
jgi:hypothetical protein